jgi:MerR family transcriptional regulator/heat shock protein HspR
MRKWREDPHKGMDDIEKEIDEAFDIDIPIDEPIYPLNIVCRLLDMHTWTVNEIVKMRLVHPKKVGKRKKLFSYKDIKRLKYVKYLIEKRGVNIQGVKVIFEIKKEI